MLKKVIILVRLATEQEIWICWSVGATMVKVHVFGAGVVPLGVSPSKGRIDPLVAVELMSRQIWKDSIVEAVVVNVLFAVVKEELGLKVVVVPLFLLVAVVFKVVGLTEVVLNVDLKVVGLIGVVFNVDLKVEGLIGVVLNVDLKVIGLDVVVLVVVAAALRVVDLLGGFDVTIFLDVVGLSVVLVWESYTHQTISILL